MTGRGGLEVRVLFAQPVVLLPDAEEPAVVGGLPVPARPLALFDDLLDGRARRVQAGHRDELRPAAEQLGSCLGPPRAGEQRPLAESCRQAGEPVHDAAVQVPHRGELLPAWHDLARSHRVVRRCGGDEPLRVHPFHAFGPLQVQEVCQRGVAERQQREPHPAGQVLRGAREVRPGQTWRGTDRAHHVRDKREMQHLFHRDPGEHLVPARDRIGLLGRQALVQAGLQAEARIQVLAHDQVLDLRRLYQQVPQMLAMLNDKFRLGHHGSRQARPDDSGSK